MNDLTYNNNQTAAAAAAPDAPATATAGDATRRDRIRKIIVENIARNFCVDEEEVIDNASFVEDLGGDSLDVFETVFAVEEHLEVSTDDTDIAEIKTVRDMMRLFGA